MFESELHSGTHDLSNVQTLIATERVHLTSPNLDVLRPQREKLLSRWRSLFEKQGNRDTSAAARRLEAIRQDQSNELFRPFLELLLNSVDYGGDNLTIHVAQTKNHGYQIVIGDKPEGSGMSSETFINTYLDPYASGSAENNMTPTGRYKKGLMGVGAQQQFGLLRNHQDSLIISSTFATGETTQQPDGKTLHHQELTVARFSPDKRGRIQMTIGGKETTVAEQRTGVTQIIRLSPQTCQEIGFTPESLAAYLQERLALLNGTTINMVVTGEKGRQKQINTNAMSQGQEAAMHRGWENIKKQSLTPSSGAESSQRKEQTLAATENSLHARDAKSSLHHKNNTERESVTYQLTSSEGDRYILEEGGEEGVNIAVSKETGKKSFVYLNVLGVRFGEPFVIEGQNVPSEVDLLFLHPMQPNEARNAVKFSREDFQMVNNLLQQIPSMHITDDQASNAAFRIHVLEALSPLLKQMNEQNQWIIEKGYNITSSFEQSYRDALQISLQEGARILPRSLAGKLAEPMQGTIFVDDAMVEKYIPNSLEQAGIRPLPEVARNTYVALLQNDQPVWIAEDQGTVILNRKFFSDEWNASEVIRAKTVLLNLYTWGRISPNVIQYMLPPARTPREAMIELVAAPTASKASEVPYVAEHLQPRELAANPPERDMRELNQVAELYVKTLKTSWPTLTFEEKQEAMNRYIRMVFVDNPTRTSTFPMVEQDGFYETTRTNSYDRPANQWHKFSPEQLDMMWDLITFGTDQRKVAYAPILDGAAFHINLLEAIVEMKTFDSAVAAQMKSIITNGNPPEFYHLIQLSDSPAMLQLYLQHNRRLPPIAYGMISGVAHPEWGFLIENRGELADIAGIEGEERETFLKIFQDPESIQAFAEEIGTLLSYGNTTQGVFGGGWSTSGKALGLIALFPAEVGAIRKLIDRYDPSFAADVLKGMAQLDFKAHALSPKKVLETAIPTMQQMGINTLDVSQDIKFLQFEESAINDPDTFWSPNQRLLWEIYHHALPISYSNSEILIPTKGEINPAKLLGLSLRSTWKRATKAPDIEAFIARQPFDEGKMATRLREQLHVINNLDQTSGSSVFELFKNSWQAVARAGLSGDRTQITFQDGISRKDDIATYHLSLEDRVGMHPREALLKLLVPGEGEGLHGIHFLSVLKDFDVVQIKTSQGGKIGVITLQAHRSEKGVDNFKVFYEEQDNSSQAPFIGTEIQMEKPVSLKTADMQAGIFRQQISALGSNIPIQRAQVVLNDELLNADHRVELSFPSPLGNVELKPLTTPGIFIAVDDTPMPRYALSHMIENASIPLMAKKLLLQSGFQINLVGSTIKTTRDNATFQKPQVVEKALQQMFEQNWRTMLESLVQSGSINFDTEYQAGHKILPNEIWTDKGVTSSMTESRKGDSIDWNNQIEVAQWIMSQPLVEGTNGIYSLRRILAESLAGPLPEDVWNMLTPQIRKKIFDAKKHQLEDPYEEFPLPGNIEAYLNRVIGQMENSIFGNNPTLSRNLIGYRGGLRQVPALAFYKSDKKLYGWSERMIETARKAMSGDVSAQAEIIEIACHEIEHRKEGSHESPMAHTGSFYQAIQSALLSIPINELI